jgi:hypothetical protein
VIQQLTAVRPGACEEHGPTSLTPGTAPPTFDKRILPRQRGPPGEARFYAQKLALSATCLPVIARGLVRFKRDRDAIQFLTCALDFGCGLDALGWPDRP